METAQKMVDEAAARAFADSEVVDKDGKVKGAHNLQAQPFMDDVKALEQMAKLMSEAFDTMSENAEAGQKNNTSGEVRYAINDLINESEIKKGLNLTLHAKADINKDTVHLAGKPSPAISIQSFLENVKDIDEFTKRIPVDKILDSKKKSKDDAIYDYITDEYGDAKSAEDYEKIMEESPRAAVAVIYRNTLSMAQKALSTHLNVKVNESECRDISKKVLASLDVDVNKNEKAVERLSRKIKDFSEKVKDIENGNYDERTKKNYFRLQF